MWERLRIARERLDAGNPDAHYSLQRSLAAYDFSGRYLSDKIVLDAACGAGHGTNYLSGAPHTVVGLDLSPEALLFAAKQGKRGVRFCCGDLFKIPFRDRSFDAVLCFQAIEHFERPDPLLYELARVLRRGGILVVSTLNDKKTSHGLNPFHLHEYTFSEFESTLRRVFPASEFFGVFGSPRYLEARRREAHFGQLFLRLDRFGFRNRLPKPVWEGFYTFGTYLVNRWVSRSYSTAKELTVRDFDIQSGNLDEALDFIAVCTKESS